MVRQSEVLAHRKKGLICKVTHVSIQAIVEGLLRFANVLEATSGTLKNVNNNCKLTVQNILYCFPVTLLVYDDECCIIMSTTFAAFVSTGVTLAYSCVRLRNLCPHQQVYQTLWLFEGNHVRLRKDLEFFRRMSNAHEWCWSCFSDRDGMWGHKGFFYISVFLCTEVNCSWILSIYFLWHLYRYRCTIF